MMRKKPAPQRSPKARRAEKARLARKAERASLMNREVTEAALTADLSEELLDAWTILRARAKELGEQRIYASHRSIVFARKVCYAFVRPRKSYLELVFFLNRVETSPDIQKVTAVSKIKRAHVFKVIHGDQIEHPVRGWIQEAYELAGG